MPRKAKEETKELKEKIVKEKTNSKKVASKKTSTKTIDTKIKNKKIVDTKAPGKKSTKSIKKEVTSKSTSKISIKENDKNKIVANKNNTKKATSTKSTKKAASIETKTKKVTTKKAETYKKVEIVEYYDLPYRYNQTIVKVLAQTPTTLFVYWDISDDDRKKYIEQYGEYFFNNTKPILIIHNKTKNYDFEVDINDFANSWYLNLVDSDCDYQVELGRRPINQYVDISNNYLCITNSNVIESPNDHILFDKLSHFVYFRNVKTNEIIKKHTNLTLLNKIGKISSTQEFYKKLYPEEAINFDRLDLNNPSSNNPTSSFK